MPPHRTETGRILDHEIPYFIESTGILAVEPS
jgi:hypothetical protein